MTGGFLDGDIFRGLAFRILLLLTLTLLPFGIIAVFQTREVVRQADSNAEMSLLALTDQAAGAERSIYLEAFGAAEALSALTLVYAGNPEACSSFLEAYRDASGTYSFIGHLPPDGVIRCSSAGGTLDFSASPTLDDVVEQARRQISAVPVGRVSKEPVLVLSQPFSAEGVFAGFMTLSVPLRVVAARMTEPLAGMAAHLVTFNADGDIIRADRPETETLADLPAGRDLKSMVGGRSVTFEDVNREGAARLYAVVPVVPGVAYAMTIWRPEDMQNNLRRSVGVGAVLPVVMWLASLVVAFWSLNRLAVRHIRKLGRQMRLFAFNRRVPRTTLAPGVPRELEEIQQAFASMADAIVRDEAALENSLRDKNILLKEVHHRVKNNLQLISSIMNMQIRRAQTEDARQVLKRLQDRILSLATVHKNLYQTEALDRVDTGALVEEIVGQLLLMALSRQTDVTISQAYASIELHADDAAPLTLLVSEAVANALKYLGPPPEGGPARLDIRLEREGDQAHFRITNTTAGVGEIAGTGLGTQLINAFARQLNGHVETGTEDGTHWLALTFPIQLRTRQAYDY